MSAGDPGPTRPHPAASGLQPGQRVGRYALLSLLGQGGMGAVYKARDEELGRVVALKVLLGGTLATSSERDRFRREAAATAALGHPGIVALYEVGEHEGRPFLVMQYVEGRALDAVLADGPLPLVVALTRVRDLARALEHAHRAGVVHRDIKPANILIDGEGRPLLVDFGLARQQTADALTVSGTIMGTPAYMSPEQAAGGARTLDARADVYSLSAVLYELLSGRPPHVGETIMDVVRNAAEQDPPPLRSLVPGLPRDVETICHTGLARQPGRRYATAAALADDIDRYLRREPIRARRPSLPYRGLRWVQRHPLIATALVLLSCVGLPAAVVAYRRPGQVEVRISRDGRPHTADAVRVGPHALSIAAGRAWGEVPAGTYRVEVTAAGHEPVEAVLTVTRGGRHERAITLRRQTGRFTLRVEPLGATILIDGVDHGGRLRGLPVPVGERALTVRREGHHDVRMRWTARPGLERRGFVYLPRAAVWHRGAFGSARHVHWLGDANQDGLPDLLYRMVNEIQVVDPWSRRRLWSLSLGAAYHQFLEVGDLDGDGVLDLALMTNFGLREPYRLLAVSGRDRKGLWEVREAPPNLPRRLPFGRPTLLDLDGDRRLDVIASGLFGGAATAHDGRDGRLRWARRVAGGALRVVPLRRASGQTQLVVIGGRELRALALDGAPRWRVDAPILPLDAPQKRLRRIAEREMLGIPWVASAELDGRPGEDLLVECVEGAGPPRLRAVSGEDGRLLWTAEVTGDLPDAQGLIDVDGDGRAEVLVHGPGPRQRTLLDGRSGRARWQRAGGSLGRLSRTPPVLFDLDGSTLRRLDGRTGRVLGEARLPLAAIGRPRRADWDGDGRPDLLVGGDDGTLAAITPTGRLLGSCLLADVPQRVARVADFNGDGAMDAITLGSGPTVVLGRQVRWARRFRAAQVFNPQAGDFDGDGRVEVVVFSSMSGVRAGRLELLDARTGETRARSERLWTRRAPVQLPRADGGVDLLLTQQTRLRRISGRDGRALREATVPLGFAAPRVADLDGDGRPEILVASWDIEPTLRILDGDSWAERVRRPAPSGAWTAPLVAELDGRPGLELIHRTNDGQLRVTDAGARTLRWGARVGSGPSEAPTLVDLDGDRRPDVVVGRGDRSLLALRGGDGQRLWRVPQACGFNCRPAAVDVDGDGTAELISADGLHGVRCVDAAGRTRWRHAPAAAECANRLAVADLDGDGVAEVLAPYLDGTLRVLDARTGRLRWFFCSGAPGAQRRPLAVDVDGDGRLEVIVSGADKTVYCLDAPRR